MSSSRSMDGREAAITVAPGRAAPGCGSVLAGGGGARGSGESMGATAPPESFVFNSHVSWVPAGPETLTHTDKKKDKQAHKR